MSRISFVALLYMFLTLFVFCRVAFAQTIFLDDFESDTIRIVQPFETEPQWRYLWNQYEGDFTEGPDPGTEEISTDVAHDGTRSLKITVTGGNVLMEFYPNTGSTWRFMREFVLGPWQFDKYNRMRFWVLIPEGFQALTGQNSGNANVQIGTYVRSSTGDPYSQGSHYYHHYNLKHTGAWHQIILDTHPNHQVGGSGSTEWGNRPYPTGEAGYNYFDALTRFYFDWQGPAPSYPSVFYFDGYELYRETNVENEDQIYSLHGVYVLDTNEISVGWMRDKNQNAIKHEVRYSFDNIHSNGWGSSLEAPNSTVTPPGEWGYNGMQWSSTDIDVAGRDTIYIAIKPENSELFRQIKIPISSSGPTTAVQLISYRASLQQGKVRLQWQIGRESGNYGYQILRSRNGGDFEPVAVIESLKSGSFPRIYSFIDKPEEDGHYYYRLRELDYNGEFEILGTVEVTISLPQQFKLNQNYPNPFNPTTAVSFTLPTDSQVNLVIYNLSGQQVCTLLNKEAMAAGSHSVTWDGTNDFGAPVSGGVYLYKLIAGTAVLSHKMVLLK